MIMIFLLYSWKNDDEFFISGEEKITEFLKLERNKKGEA